MRIDIPSPAIPEGWPAVLEDDWAIARHIADISPQEVDLEFVREHFRFGKAELRMVPIADLVQGHEDGNRRIVSRERKYAAMDPATVPPLVVEEGEIKDGNHRYRVGLKRGETHLPCYVVEYPDEE